MTKVRLRCGDLPGPRSEAVVDQSFHAGAWHRFIQKGAEWRPVALPRCRGLFPHPRILGEPLPVGLKRGVGDRSRPVRDLEGHEGPRPTRAQVRHALGPRHLRMPRWTRARFDGWGSRLLLGRPCGCRPPPPPFVWFSLDRNPFLLIFFFILILVFDADNLRLICDQHPILFFFVNFLLIFSIFSL